MADEKDKKAMIYPRSRKRFKKLEELDEKGIISPRPPDLSPDWPFRPPEDFGQKFVENARRAGEALDDGLEQFAAYFGEKIEPKLEVAIEEASVKCAEIKNDLYAFFKKYW